MTELRGPSTERRGASQTAGELRASRPGRVRRAGRTMSGFKKCVDG
jgi:hypothetical protein